LKWLVPAVKRYFCHTLCIPSPRKWQKASDVFFIKVFSFSGSSLLPLLIRELPSTATSGSFLLFIINNLFILFIVITQLQIY